MLNWGASRGTEFKWILPLFSCLLVLYPGFWNLSTLLINDAGSSELASQAAPNSTLEDLVGLRFCFKFSKLPEV